MGLPHAVYEAQRVRYREFGASHSRASGLRPAAEAGGIAIAPGSNINYVTGHAGVAHRTTSGPAQEDALTHAVQRQTKAAERDSCSVAGSEVSTHVG